MSSGMIPLNQIMEIEQNCVTRILVALLFTLKPKIFLKMFLTMLRDGLIHLTMIKMIKDPFSQVRIKSYLFFFKDGLQGKIITEVAALRAKTYIYLIDGYGDDDDDEENKIINKRAKGTKKCVIKRKLIFKN